jgi:thiamine-phosphate pyrophosphorylase
VPSSHPIIYFISEGNASEENYEHAAADIVGKASAAAEASVGLFQIREKRLSASRLFDLVLRVVSATVGSGVKVLVNGRLDVALAAGAAGVHLPSDGLPAAEVRRLSSETVIGVSAHSVEEAERAKTAGADFVTFGPVFETPGKDRVAGVQQLQRVCTAVAPMPVLALGGIVDETTIKSALNAGADGYASIRYLNDLLNARRRDV